MNPRATILCPVDFSDASRGAVRYARVLVEHFGGSLILLAVEDPLLTEAIDLGTGHVWNPDDTRAELARFVKNVIGNLPMKAGANGLAPPLPTVSGTDISLSIGKLTPFSKSTSAWVISSGSSPVNQRVQP